ncbi:NapC/NirT family cytochrome c [Sutterella sp.]|uniref:cytochrome c3 family protein n=1 Tax=Sutterella sp. TaxID=1981025 RepID=UPI0026E0F7C3|nr:NapC/NirT family cytochrome c [Sutterella sp.]MDO5530623.1 NapC/NirT family cytochrome c [Sutterella sp.]
MKKDSPWYLALWCVVGIAIGIVFVGVLTSVVHWAGTEKFCGEFCHDMTVTYEAYKKGDHYRTDSGVTAGCSDCHLKNESNHFAGPIDYTALLIDKAIAGSKSAWGFVRGTMNTPEKQVEKREEMATAVHQQMIDRNFATCRGCHDVERMYDPKRPILAMLHKGMGPNAEKKVDCLACHPTAGHNYGYVIPFKAAAK